MGSENFVLSFARSLGFTHQARPGWKLPHLKLTVEGFRQTVQSSSYPSAIDPDHPLARPG